MISPHAWESRFGGPQQTLGFDTTLDVVTADFNGDGRADLSVLARIGDRYVLEIFLDTDGGMGALAGAYDLATTQASYPGMVAFDVDGDGAVDMLIPSVEGLILARNRGRGYSRPRA